MIDRSVLTDPSRIKHLDLFNDAKDTADWLYAIGTTPAIRLADQIVDLREAYAGRGKCSTNERNEDHAEKETVGHVRAEGPGRATRRDDSGVPDERR